MRQPAFRIVLTVFFVGLLAVPVIKRKIEEHRASHSGTNARAALAHYGFYLQDVSAAAGVHFVHQGPTLDHQLDPIMPEVASMGAAVSIVDFDRDGWPDIYVTNSAIGSKNALYHNNHDGTFTDVSSDTGTCRTLWGWGAKFGDLDNDGWQDLFVTNGLRSAGKENYIPLLLNATITKPGVDFTDVSSWPDIGGMTWSGYQKKKLFHNLNGQAFKEISKEAGVDNDLDGRGVVMADFDNDGRLEMYQTNADQRSLFYHLDSPAAGNYIEFKLTGTKSNRDAIGARIQVTAGGLTQIREVNGGNGYAGQSSLKAHFGLGTAAKIDSVEISWPSGLKQKIDGTAINHAYHITEGQALKK